jgi:hypothetical protein
MVKRMVRVFGNLQKEIFIKDNGNKIVKMEKDIIITMEVQYIEDILKIF